MRSHSNPPSPAFRLPWLSLLLAASLLLGGCGRAGEPPPSAPTLPGAIAPAASLTAAFPPLADPASTLLPPGPIPAGTRSTELLGTPVLLETPTPTAESDPLAIYFTDPLTESPAAEFALAAALDAAQQTIDVAMYNLGSWRLKQALLDAHRRGVQVRMIMESTSMDDAFPQELAAAGIPIIGDRREGLMHNKFAVLDGYEVWTGSANWSYGLYKDNNNLLRIRSTLAAQDYTIEFEEMFIHDRFGPDPGIDTPHPLFTLDDTLVEVYFSPDDQPENRILELVRQARESVNILAYSFTSDPLAQALMDAKFNSAYVRIVQDADMVSDQRSSGGEYDRLVSAGLDVRLDTLPGLMHHKVVIVDRNWVVTGSYNFTRAAAKTNDENVVVVRSPALAKQYMNEFELIYGQARAY